MRDREVLGFSGSHVNMKMLAVTFGLAAMIVGGTSTASRSADISRAIQSTAGAGSVRSASSGVFTEAQSSRGAAVYNRECSTCHGERLKGGEGAPALTGEEFS